MALLEELFGGGGGLPALSAPGLARLWALLFLSSLVLLLCARAARADTGGIEVETADFVIVGGGTAGCVIAARLCQRFGDASILLLERGQERNQTEEESVRAMRRAFDTWLNPNLAEVWLSAPNAGLGGRAEPIITGRTLGGTSAINAGQWTVPGLRDVEAWGFDGLNVRTAGLYYARAQSKLKVGQPPPPLRHQTFVPWLNQAPGAGLDTSRSPATRFDTKNRDRAAINAVTALPNGRRQDSCTAYLSPVLKGSCKKNLRLEQSAVTTQILVRGTTAVGVRYRKYDEDGVGYEERLVQTRREVISCAGPYGSPNLLQLSGIGPGAVLRRAGVPVLMDLPVGTFVQGRPVGRIVDVYTTVPLAPENDPALVFSKKAQKEFNKGKGGVLGITITSINGVLISEDSLIAGTAATPSDVIGQPLFLLTCLLNPTSRGSLTLSPDAPSRPLTPPDVTLNLLGTEGEAATMTRCLERLGGVNDRVRAAGDLGLVNIDPGPGGINRTYIERTTTDSYHFVGGCGVGSVVDGRYRVRGVSGLRVVDASVIPEIPRYAGVMATVYALAEHASELIIADAGRYGSDYDSESDSGSDSSSESSCSSGSDCEDDVAELPLFYEEAADGTVTRGFTALIQDDGSDNGSGSDEELIEYDDLQIQPYLLE